MSKDEIRINLNWFKNHWFSIGILLVILISWFVFSNPIKKFYSEDENDFQGNKDSEIQHNFGIIEERFRWGDNIQGGEVIRNKLSKTAEIRTFWKINNSEEYYMGVFGQTLSPVPFWVNTFCGIMTFLFDDTLNSQEKKEEIPVIEEIPLEGYEITNVYAEFIDYEEGTKIADCTVTGKSWEDIYFNAYRDYPYDVSTTQIGVKSESVEV